MVANGNKAGAPFQYAESLFATLAVVKSMAGLPGNMGGDCVREAFLSVLDDVEKGKADPRDLLTYTFKILCDLREMEKVNLNKLAGLDADGALKILRRYFKCGNRTLIEVDLKPERNKSIFYMWESRSVFSSLPSFGAMNIAPTSFIPL